MFTRFAAFLKKFFGITSPSTTENVQAPPEKQCFSIPHDWPFPSPEPPNPEYLVGELIKGVEVEGEHVFFFWGGQKRRHIRTPKGTETILARHMVWWMEGRKHPSVASGLTTNCGEPKCIKLSHLILRTPQTVLGPSKPAPVRVVPKAEQPPEPKHVVKNRPRKTVPAQKFEKGDRTKCITRKVYFETEQLARQKCNTLNRPEVRGRGRKVYPYPCPNCNGFHTTKINPKKFKPKKVGNW